MSSKISDIEFEEAVKQWTPKLKSMSFTVHVPYMDREDLEQELMLVLLKCISKFDPERGVKFHTFFHRACWNKIGNLTAYANRHYGPTENINLSLDVLLTGDDVDENLTSLGEVIKKLSVSYELSPELQLEFMGFTGLQIPFMLGKMDFLSVAATAKVYEVDEQELQQIRPSVKRQIAWLNATTDRRDGLRLEVIGEKI